MSFLRVAVMYTALALGANTAFADADALNALRDGSMKKLNFHSAARDVPAAALVDMVDAPRDLAEFQGKYVVLNFWATWCAPCRKEMPGLEALQEDLGGDGFEVVTVATGRNPVPAIKKFFGQTGVDDLIVLRDPKQAFARDMRILGLPVTVILNPDGQEIARLQGDAEWDSDSAKAILSALIAAKTQQSTTN